MAVTAHPPGVSRTRPPLLRWAYSEHLRDLAWLPVCTYRRLTEPTEESPPQQKDVLPYHAFRVCLGNWPKSGLCDCRLTSTVALSNLALGRPGVRTLRERRRAGGQVGPRYRPRPTAVRPVLVGHPLQGGSPRNMGGSSLSARRWRGPVEVSGRRSCGIRRRYPA